jgi:hypothetical protein
MICDLAEQKVLGRVLEQKSSVARKTVAESLPANLVYYGTED